MKSLFVSAAVAILLAGTSAPALAASAVNPPAAQEADANSIYEFMALCMAADIIDQPPQDVPTTPEREEREEESMAIFQVLMLAGEAAGHTEDDTANLVAELIGAWEADPALLADTPPAQVRSNCVQIIEDAG